MAHEGVYVLLIEYAARCGKSVSADTQVEAWANQAIIGAEAVINCVCRVQFATTAAAFAALPAAGRELLMETASCLAAVTAIIYDMSLFTSRVEAEDMINVLRDAALRNLAILRDKKVQRFIITGA